MNVSLNETQPHQYDNGHRARTIQFAYRTYVQAKKFKTTFHVPYRSARLRLHYRSVAVLLRDANSRTDLLSRFLCSQAPRLGTVSSRVTNVRAARRSWGTWHAECLAPTNQPYVVGRVITGYYFARRMRNLFLLYYRS